MPRPTRSRPSTRSAQRRGGEDSTTQASGLRFVFAYVQTKAAVMGGQMERAAHSFERRPVVFNERYHSAQIAFALLADQGTGFILK